MKGTPEGARHSDEPLAGAPPRQGFLNRVIESSRYLVVIGVVASLIASASAFVWGAYKTVTLLIEMVQTRGIDVVATTGLIALMDKFLIAVGLYIFAVGMYELFIEDVKLPEWLVVHNLHGLKTLLSGIIILVLALAFLSHVVQWSDPQAILEIGIGTAVVTGGLIAFNVFGERE